MNTVLAVVALFALPKLLGAQAAAPVVELSRPSASTVYTFNSILNVVEFADGKVVVNDAGARRLSLLDGKLSTQKILLDTAGSINSYGTRAVSLLDCNCNEVWFPDGNSRSILTFNHDGQQNRVMSAPRPGDFALMAFGRTIGDSFGNLYYRGAQPAPAVAGAPPLSEARLDSTPLLKTNFESRKLDTIAKLRTLRGRRQYWVGAEGKEVMHIAVEVLAFIDEWTVTTDGTVAIVRGHDYHVDWLLPDGRKHVSAKLPFDFKPVSEADKAHLMDSTRKAESALRRATYERTQRAGGIPGPDGNRLPMAAFEEPIVDDVPFARMPDYYPPIRPGAVRSDLDGNIWILPTTSSQSRAGELVYDVVNREGGLVARVRLPVGRSVAGFGRNGNVYLMSQGKGGLWMIERTSLPAKL